MQGHFKVKTKLSWSPGKSKEGVYVVKAHMGRRPTFLTPAEFFEKTPENRRPTSVSAQKIKSNASKLFKKAHVIQSTETYLNQEKIQRNSNTNGSSSPNSQKDLRTSVPKVLVASDNVRNIPKTRTREFSQRKSDKDIQRTLEIAYKGKTKNVPIETQLMTTLSKLILGDEKSQDDFFLQILGQSSIHGDEDNFIDFGDSEIFGEAHPENHHKHLFK